jgi:hypothetical protein
VDFGRVCEHDGNDVEADAIPGSGSASGEFAGDTRHMGALFGTDGAFGRAVCAVLARFDFDDDEGVAIPGDDVGFGVAGSGTIVTSDDDVAVAAEITMSEILATAAEGERGSPELTAPGVAKTIEDLKDHL